MKTKNLENLAVKIINKANMNHNKNIDPITIIIIIGVILSLIRVIQECRNNKNNKDKLSDSVDLRKFILNLINSLSFWQKLKFNKILKTHLSKKQYEEYGVSLRNAIMEVGKNLDDNESLTLLEATNV